MRTKRVTLDQRSGERGAILVISAAFMIVAALMAAAVIDLGSLRKEKKEVTLSTDAAALAVAAVVDFPALDAAYDPGTKDIPCTSVPILDGLPNIPSTATAADIANDYLTINGQSVMASCMVTFSLAGGGFVTVEAREDVAYNFSGVTGENSGSVRGTSSAAVEQNPGGGLRPIGLCAATDPVTGTDDIDFWRTQAAADGRVAVQPTLKFEIRNSANPCGGSGNFGQVDFENNPNGQCVKHGQFCFDLNESYPKTPIPSPIGSNTGNDWSAPATENPVEDFRNNNRHIWIPAFGTVSACPPEYVAPTPSSNGKGGSGSGNYACFPIKYFVEVEIEDYSFKSSTKFFTFKVYRILDYVTGKNGLPATADATMTPAFLCATSENISACPA